VRRRTHRRLPRLGFAAVLAACIGASGVATAGPPELPEGFEPPVLVERADFSYPPELAELETPPRGRVLIQITVGIDGVPKELKLVEGVHPEIDQLALEAVSKLRFTPATLKGELVEVEQLVPIPVEPPAPPPEPDPDPDPEPEPDPDPDPEREAGVEYETDPSEGPEIDLGPVRIYGTITEAGQRTPIDGASVIIVPARPDQAVGPIKKRDYTPEKKPKWEVGTTSDNEGRFEVAGLPKGALKVRVIILAPGFERFEAIASMPAGSATSVKYQLLRMADNPYRTVVESNESAKEEVAQRTISVAEITSLPGTQGDALKALQNFPGVARAPFGVGLLAVRGTGPNDSAVFLGHHEIPTLFHFGGLTSVFNSDMLERIDFVPGNFDSRYGDAIGGIISVKPRKPRTDGFHGYIDSDVFDTGVLAEGPIGKGSWALSGRRSYIDLLLGPAIPDDAGINFSVAPRYYDYQGIFDYPLGGGDFQVRAFGSDDRNKLVLNSPNEEGDDADDLKDSIETISFFHRLDLEYEKRSGPWRFLITPSYRYEEFDLSLLGFLDLDIRTHNLSFRSEVERKFSKRHAWRIGTEVQATFFKLDVEAPPLSQADSDAGSSSERIATSIQDETSVPAVYTTFTLGVTDKFRLLPGARAGYYTGQVGKGFVDPRVRFAWDLADNTTIKGGTGLYTQSAQPVEYSDEFGNPRLGLKRGIQNSLGVAQGLPRDISIDATGFFNYIYDESTSSQELTTLDDGTIAPEVWANTQRGRVYGLEMLLRRQGTGAFFGWVAYTLSRSERRPTSADTYVPFDFDQRHILTVLGVYRLPKNWQVGARFRVVSGLPRTPVVGAVYDADADFYIPIEGETNSARVPAFHQLDLRVDKKWIRKVISITAYLDVQNAYNRQNPEFFIPAYDYSAETIVPGLPIIPSIGTKIEW